MTTESVQSLCLYVGAQWTIMFPRVAPPDADRATWHLYQRDTPVPQVLTADATINGDTNSVTVTLTATTTADIKPGDYNLFIKVGDTGRQIARADVRAMATPAEVRDTADLPDPGDGGGGVTPPRFSVYSGASAQDILPELSALTSTQATRAGVTLTIDTIDQGTMWIVVPASMPAASILNGDFAGDNILLRAREAERTIAGVDYRIYSVPMTGEFTIHAVLNF